MIKPTVKCPEEMAINPTQNDSPSAPKDTMHKGTLAKPNLEDLWSVAYLPGSKVRQQGL
jgi:hypothetical protein